MLVSGCSGYLDATTVGFRSGLPTFKGRYDGRYSTSSTKLAFGVVLVGISQCISCIFESCVYQQVILAHLVRWWLGCKITSSWKVFRFHYHSQKVIESLGYYIPGSPIWILNMTSMFFSNMSYFNCMFNLREGVLTPHWIVILRIVCSIFRVVSPLQVWDVPFGFASMGGLYKTLRRRLRTHIPRRDAALDMSIWWV